MNMLSKQEREKLEASALELIESLKNGHPFDSLMLLDKFQKSIHASEILALVRHIDALERRVEEAAPTENERLYKLMLRWCYDQQMKALVKPVMEFDEWLWKIGCEIPDTWQNGKAAIAGAGEGEEG
jgi:hypothetical protein